MAKGQRVVRFKEGRTPVKLQPKGRSVELILEELDSSTAVDVSKNLTEAEVMALVDYGLECDEAAKAHAAIAKAIKSIVLPVAKADKWKLKAGSVGTAKIGASSSTVVVPTDMVKVLARIKKQALFDTLFSVKIGEVKKYLGEDVLKQASTVTTEPFGTVSFKRLKHLKKKK